MSVPKTTLTQSSILVTSTPAYVKNCCSMLHYYEVSHHNITLITLSWFPPKVTIVLYFVHFVTSVRTFYSSQPVSGTSVVLLYYCTSSLSVQRSWKYKILFCTRRFIAKGATFGQICRVEVAPTSITSERLTNIAQWHAPTL